MAKKVTYNPIFGSERLDPLYSNPQYYGDSGSQYDRVSLMPLEEQRAQAQTGWDSFGNIAGRLVGRAGLSVIESAGMLGYGLPKALVTGDLNSLFDNELSQGFKSLDEALVQKTPFYQTEAEKNAPLFSKEYLTSTPFWGNLIGEGGGFVLGAMASGNLIGRGISSAGKLANSMGVIASDAEKIREVANAAKSGESVAEKLIATRRTIKAENLASYYTQKIGGNMYEAGVEARGVKEEILRAKREEFEKTNLPGAQPTEEQKATWESIATTYSNASFGLNLGLLMIDGLNMGRFLKGYKATNRTVNALQEAGKYTEKGILGKTLDRAGTVLGGGLAEAAQEGGQFVTEKMTADMAKTQKTADATRSFNDYFISTIKGLEQTFGTKEGQESMLAGFLLATPFNIPSAISEGSLDKHGIEAMNANATGKTFQSLLKHNHDNFINQVGEKKDKYAQMNSHILHEDLQRDGFYKYVKSRDDAGRFDDVLDDINDFKRMDLNAFKEAYGDHYDEVTRQETLNELEKQARYYQNTKEEIESVFSNHQNKEALIEGSVKINNLTDRINKLDTKLTNANLPELIRTNLQTDKLNLINEKASEELKLGEYLSERKTLAEDQLEKEAATEIEEPEETTKKKTKTKKVVEEEKVKEIEKGDEVSYNNSKAIVEAVTEDENGKKIFTLAQENGTKIQVDEASLDNAGVEVETEEEDKDNFETQNTKTKTGELEADIFDEDGNPIKWASLNPDDHKNSPHINASDLSLVDLRKKEKGISEDLKDSDFHNSLKINADAADVIKEDILNSGVDDYSYEYKKEKDSDGNLQYNIYAKKDKSKPVKIGYFLDFNKNFASNGAKDKITIDKFIKQYLKSGTESSVLKADVLNKLKDINKVITAEEKLDLTNSTYINTRILNSYENNTLADVMNSPYANRWKVNGEFVVAKYSKGSYVLIDKVSNANEKIFNDTVKKPYVQNSVGAQFVIMVKRPNKKGKDFYSFINLKGAPITDRLKNDFVNRLNDPKVDKASLVQELNEKIFIGSKGKSFNVETPQGDISIPVHLYFDTDYQGNIVVKREAKVVDGIKPDIIVDKKLQKAKLTPEDAILNYAYERIPSDKANDIDDVKDRIVTNADKKLWDSFFGFSTTEFKKTIPSLTSLAPDDKVNTKQDNKNNVELSKKVITDILKHKSFIKGLTEDGKLVEIDAGVEYKAYYNTNTKETYQRATDISSDKKENSGNEGLKKTAQGLGNKVDKIYRDFFDPKRKNKTLDYKDYNIVTEKNKKEFENFIKQLEVLKKEFAEKGETVYANNIVLYNNDLKVAGTVDVLTIDKFGTFRIYDVKTMRGNQFKEVYKNEQETDDKGKKVTKYYSNIYGKSNYESHSDQLSIYRILLNNTHGVLAKNLSIIPIELDYQDGDKNTSKLNLLSDYIYNVEKKDDVADLSLTETQATQKADDAKVQYSLKKLIEMIQETDDTSDEFIKSLGINLRQFQAFMNLNMNDPKYDNLSELDPVEYEKFFLIEYVKSIVTENTNNKKTAQQSQQTGSKDIKDELNKLKTLISKTDDLTPIMDDIFKVIDEEKYVKWQETLDTNKIQKDLKGKLEKAKSENEVNNIVSKYLLPKFIDSELTASEPTQKKNLFGNRNKPQVGKDTSNTGTSENPDNFNAKPFDEYTETEQQFIEEANQEVKRILNVDVKLEQNGLNFGSFRKGLIYLASKAPKGTLWHEAFHGIFSILSSDEKTRVLSIAERVFGKPTLEEIQYLKKIYADRGYKNANNQFLYKKILEEKVADLFQDYMNEKPTTFFGRFFQMLKNLINYFLGKTEDPSFVAFFDEIYSGKYRAVSPSVSAVESFKPIGNASGSERDMLLSQLTAYYVNRKKYYSEENNNLDSFVKSMLNKIRMGHSALLDEVYEEKKSTIESDYEKGKITEKEAYAKLDIIDADIEKKYTKSEINGVTYTYPKYISKQYEDLIVSEVLDFNDFRKANEFEEEDEKETYYGENEFEKSIHDTPAGQAVRAKMLDMVIVDKYFEIKPIDAPGIINNLTFALNNLSKDKITERLESLISPEEDFNESDFSKSLRVVLEEYNTNKAFRKQFHTAFDRCFVQAIKAVSTRATKKNGIFIRVENNKDHILQQIEEWQDEVLVNLDERIVPLEDGTEEEKNATLVKYLGITLQPDVYREPTTQEILTRIRRNIFTPNTKTQQIQGADFLFSDKSSYGWLEQLAENNIRYRLDLGELTFRNADGKPMSSIINNSDIIKRLNNVKNRHLVDVKKGETFKDKWGIFIGSKFGDKSSDYKGIDPKAYFLTLAMMYSNKDTDGKTSKPYYVVQQPSDKNTTFVFQGKTFTKSRALQATILREEVQRQNLQMEEFVKVLQDINSFDMSEGEKISLLTKGEHYVGKQTIGEVLEVYNRILNGEIDRSNLSVPRAFKYTNIPFINDEVLSIDEINNLNDDYYLSLLDDLIADETGYYIYEKSNGERVLSQEVSESKLKRFNSDGIDTTTGDVIVDRHIGKIEQTRQTFGISTKEIIAIAGIKSTDIDSYLKFFSINDYLNRLLILSEVNPNLTQFKNNPAITKRAAGQAASGPNFHDPDLAVYDEKGNFVSDDFTFGIIPDRQKIFNSSVKNNEEAETLDAQGAELVSERMNRYLRTGRISEKTSKKNKFNDEPYLDWLIVKAYADDNRQLIANLSKGGSPLKIDKTVGYGTEFYLKTSVKVFARKWNSDFAKPGQTRTLTHKTKVENGVDANGDTIYREVVYTETYEAFQDTYNGKWYLPIPGREVEWNLMNEMQKNNMSAVFAESAVKKGAKKIAEYVESNLEEPVKNPAKLKFSNGNTMSYLDYRQQQETPPDKRTIGDGSQGIQQIDANLPLDYVPEGDTRTIAEIKEDNDNLLLEIKNYQKDLYLRGIESINIDGKRYSAFVNYIVSSLDSSKATDRMKDFFEIGPDGNFKFSTSLPMMETKFEELVMAYINNNIAKHKVPGEKMILTTSEFYRPARDANGNILTTYEIEQLRKEDPDIYDKLDFSEDLRAPSIEKDGQKYAEVVVTEEYLEHLGITIQDWVKLKNSEDEEDKKIFDKISTFMGYRIPTQAHHSMLPCKIVDFMPTHFGSVVVLPAEVTKLSGSDYDVDSLFAQRYELYKDKDGKIKLADNSETSFRKYLRTNKLAKEYLSQMDKQEKADLYMKIDDLQEELEPLLTSLDNERDSILEKKKKTISEITEEDIDKGIDSMADSLRIIKEIELIKSQIKSIRAQITELEERKILKVKEILGLEDNFNPNMVYNEMLDNRMAILTSHEGRKNINYPAQNHFKTLHEDIFDKMEHLRDSDDNQIVYATHSNFFNEWLKAYAGKGSISGSANITKDHAFLQKNNAEFISNISELWDGDLNISDIYEYDVNLAIDANGNLYVSEYNVQRPKSDTLSNFVSMSVDNGNDQTLYKYNLNSQTMSEGATMGSTGFGRTGIAVLFKNSVAEAISGKIVIEDTLLNGKFVDKIKVVKDYISNKFKHVPFRKINIDDIVSTLNRDNFLRIKQLLQLSSTQIKNLNEEDMELMTIQYGIAKIYLEYAKTSKDYFTVNTVLNYNREVGRYGYDVYKMINAIDTIKSSDDFKITGIQDNEFINEVGSILNDLTGVIENNLLSYNTRTKDLVKRIAKSTSKNKSDTASLKFQHALRKEFINFLAQRIYRHRYDSNTESMEETGNKVFPEFGGVDVANLDILTGKKLIEQYNKVRSRIKKYILGRALKIDDSNETYPFPRLVLESFANVDPIIEKKLVNDFQDMLRETDVEIRDLARMMLQHIGAHDNFRYVSGSIVRIVRPMFFESLNQVYKGDSSNPGLEDLFNYEDAEGNGLDMETFESTLAEMMGVDKSNLTSVINEFGKFFFSDGRNRQFVLTKDKVFNKDRKDIKTAPRTQEIVGKRTGRVVKATVGYDVKLIASEEGRFPFAPDFFQTVKRPPSDQPNGVTKYTLYNKVYVAKSKDGKTLYCRYDKVEQAKLIRNEAPKFNSKFYQLPYAENIEVLNQGVDIITSKEFKSKSKLDALGMQKARKEIKKILEGVSNQDKFQNDEDRELYSGFVDNKLETDNSTEDSEVTNKEKNLPAAMLNSLLKIDKLDDFSTELQSAQNKYLFRTFDIDALRLHQENLENIENKKQSNTTTTRTQRVNNNPTSGIINEVLNKPGAIIQKAADDNGPGPSEGEAFSGASLLTESQIEVINDNHKELIANFDSYSEELSKAGFNSVEELMALQDPIQRKKIFRLICKKK
jgi:hypothetical protein